jgi:hypothetical protein
MTTLLVAASSLTTTTNGGPDYRYPTPYTLSTCDNLPAPFCSSTAL